MKCAQADKMDAGNQPAEVCSGCLMATVAAGQQQPQHSEGLNSCMITVSHVHAPVCSSLNRQEHKQEGKKNAIQPKEGGSQEIRAWP